MNILVCIKQVPDTSKVEVDSETGILKRDGVGSKMNPYDLYALETGLKIKEQNGGTVKVISMGPPKAMEVIKEAYMIGADEGILVSDRKFAGADVLATAYTISQGIRQIKNIDLIICGKQTIDGDTAQVGPEIAEYLNIPHITNVIEIIKTNKESIIVKVDMMSNYKIMEIKYPCLITVEKEIFQPRLLSLTNEIKTKEKEIKIISLKDFNDKDENKYGISGSPTQVEKIFEPKNNMNKDILKGSINEICCSICSKLKELKFV